MFGQEALNPVFASQHSAHLPVAFCGRSAPVSRERGWRSLSAPIQSSRRGIMKFLLTSSGISNDSIRKALVDLLGKPIAESSALCIPTAAYACPGGASMAYRFISGSAASPLCEVGWKSLGVLELTALPSIT